MTAPTRRSPQDDQRGAPRRLTASEIDAIKAEHPIERVVASYGVALTRLGARLVGLCPLHVETHPSFTVVPDAARFYCFGCHQGGDVIDLVCQLEQVSFPQALERLAGSAPLRHSDRLQAHRTAAERVGRSQRCLQARASPAGQVVLQVATLVYHQTLMETPAAQTYLARRGVGEEVARRCRLGYCAGTQLVGELRRQGVPMEAAWAVGLLVGRVGQGRPEHLEGHEVRERLAGRLTIPEMRGGQALWLTGRLVEEAIDAPRYMSLPGPRPLLGLEAIAGRRAVIGVEGSFDWLTLVSWGLPGFAALGGSLSAEALAALDGAQVIYLAFDRDSPGQRAAQALATRLGGRARLVALPDGVNDVNDLGRLPDGAARFRACVLQAAHRPSASAPLKPPVRQPGEEAAA
jgi:DNA primase